MDCSAFWLIFFHFFPSVTFTANGELHNNLGKLGKWAGISRGLLYIFLLLGGTTGDSFTPH